MKKTTKVLAFAIAMLSALNFVGCKEDDGFDLSFANCVESVDAFAIKDGDIISDKSIWVGQRLVNLKDGMWENVSKGQIITIGKSKDDMKELYDDVIDLEPFTAYYVEITPYIELRNDEGERVYGEKQEIKFYSIPKHKLALTADYGEGEIAANVHWKLQYFYENEDKGIYYDCNEKVSSVSVNMITDADVKYNNSVMEFHADIDSCYILQGGTRERPDFPAYINKYYNDGKTISRYDPVIYNFCFDVKVPVGESLVTVKDTIRGIFAAKQQDYVNDKYFNAYRIMKIGNKTWTIDDYRGLYTLIVYKSPYKGNTIDLYGSEERTYAPQHFDDNENVIAGYHISNEEDWNDLLSYYGIAECVDSLPTMIWNNGYYEDFKNKLEMQNNSVAKYFTKKGNWQELLSAIGWVDDESNLTESYQGSFNAKPLCMEHKEKLAVYYISKYDNGSWCIVISSKYGILKGFRMDFGGATSIRYVKD